MKYEQMHLRKLVIENGSGSERMFTFSSTDNIERSTKTHLQNDNVGSP